MLTIRIIWSHQKCGRQRSYYREATTITVYNGNEATATVVAHIQQAAITRLKVWKSTGKVFSGQEPLSWLCKLSHDCFLFFILSLFHLIFNIAPCNNSVSFSILLYIHTYIFLEYSFIVILHTTNRCFSTFYL